MKERIYIVPTRYGFMYAGGIVVTLMAGAIYSNNLVYLLSFFLVALFLIGMVQTHNNLRGLQVEKVEFKLAPSDSRGIGKIWLKSNSSEGNRQIQFVEQNKNSIFDLIVDHIPKKSQQIQKISFKTTDMGIKKIKKIKAATIFPFGLFYSWRSFTLDCEYFVYPKPIGTQLLPNNYIFGESVENVLGDSGDDFSQHIRYTFGHSQKHIDWKAYARGRPLLVKEFKDGEKNAIELMISNSPGPLKQQLHQLSKWIHICHEEKRVFSINLGSWKIQPNFGLKHKNICLKALAQYGEKSV